jgi:hypothetical protein
MKKLIPLFVLLVIVALAGVGVAYGLWSEHLFINGQVKTGEVDVEFSPCATNDPDGTIDPGWTKDVASCVCRQSGPDNDSYGDSGPDHMDIFIANGYPYYKCSVKYDIHNNGTIPVHLEKLWLDYNQEALAVKNVCKVKVGNDWEVVELGHQMHPSERIWCQMDIMVKQAARELNLYAIAKNYLFVQWNESQYPPPQP